MSSQRTKMRMANCGNVVIRGWRIAWAQVIGLNHPLGSEDTIAFRDITVSGTADKAVGLAVADGVGGGACGEIASAALADHCVRVSEKQIGDADKLERWVLAAEEKVQSRIREVSTSPGAATLAAAWFRSDGVGHILRIGDARLYQFDGTSLHQLTEDQTYAYLGESPPSWATHDDPARMVGTGYSGDLEIQRLSLALDDVLLLCSDGLHRSLEIEDLSGYLNDTRNLGSCAVRLAQAARLNGSADDISLMLLARTN